MTPKPLDGNHDALFVRNRLRDTVIGNVEKNRFRIVLGQLGPTDTHAEASPLSHSEWRRFIRATTSSCGINSPRFAASSPF